MVPQLYMPAIRLKDLLEVPFQAAACSTARSKSTLDELLGDYIRRSQGLMVFLFGSNIKCKISAKSLLQAAKIKLPSES